ncbi:DUF5134 domain-containing protein [Amycolatopsis palatopharyngis]|uniref:DUF5134 domain-containing protein n=1 Tax=Amycolatopsis palatopharyngis TaxID=187982 RepID=UPI000E25B9C8|nr:DUF5134 domain-containing protein [Amycolatopsis palatopharyngis]
MPSMTNPLLPDWLRLVWTLLLAGVAVVHIGHVWTMSGQRQWWHVSHTVMAAAMVVMYLQPHSESPRMYEVGLVVFALLSVGLAAIVVSLRRREQALNPLWVSVVVDLLAMTYMFVPAASRPAPLTSLLVLYLGVQAIAWTTGLWSRVALVRGAVPAVAEAGAAGGAAAPDGAGQTFGLYATSALDVRLTLALMAAGMVYMLVVM